MNNEFPSRAIVEQLRRQYPKGTRVELISMDDPYSKLKPGDQGSVKYIDDIGTIFVAWDNGSGLGVAYGQDRIKVASALTDRIAEQILSIREGSKHNMLDRRGVQHEANELGYYELVVFLEEHPKEYAHFIFTGERS